MPKFVRPAGRETGNVPMSTVFGPSASPLSPLSPENQTAPAQADAEARPLKPEDAAAELKGEHAQRPNSTVTEKVNALIHNIEKVIVGKRETVKQVLCGLLARGHILIEDVPGVGKTTLARALAKSIDCKFSRIQFTPDLLPSDVVGVSVFEQRESRFKFHPGPLFANVILADEINRTAPRTQSALLEAMNDFQVSVDGHTHPLPNPFMVLATENPIEYAGTYPLPEAQLDRFILRVTVGYPDRDSELAMLKGHKLAHPIEHLDPVITAEEVAQLQDLVRTVAVEDALSNYILEIADKTRHHKGLMLGVSPRGVKMLYRAAQASAVLDARKYVVPDDIKRLVIPVLTHRIIEKNRDAGGARRDGENILAEILEEVPVPI
ncbi:MAG: MoxR family ATPase [Planctomycetota bacterium]|nr:MoxR family ATPase [Planctomycetota bacterium]